MTPFTRRMELATLVYKHRPEAFTYQLLADRYGVSKRTIADDVAELGRYFNIRYEQEVCWFDRSK